MELFFLCTIIMAAVSFISIALSQPPVNFSINLEAAEAPSSSEIPTGESGNTKASFSEYRELLALGY